LTVLVEYINFKNSLNQYNKKMKKLFLISFLLLLAASASAQTYNVPEVLYYKFSNNGPSSTPNYANPGEGSNPASILGLTIGSGGQFDSALVGNGGSSSTNYLNSGWLMNFGQGSWTISLWISNVPASSFGYVFGPDITSSFRCFTSGASGPTGIRLDGGSPFIEIDIPGVLPGPSVVHFVYDSTTSILKGYLNGLLVASVSEPPLNLTASVPFKVGGYGTSGGLTAGGLLDEFRVYRRALDSTEISATWNQSLPHTVTSVQQTSGIADDYRLSQNYPNPFNPETKIDFSVPKNGFVELRVYNSLGQEVKMLVSKELSTGSYSINFSGTSLGTGVYYYTLTTDGFTETKKMLLIK
jgi:hypothetical protein